MWITSDDLQSFLTDSTFQSLYEDGSGAPNRSWVAQDIALAEAKTNARLLISNGRALPSSTSDLVKLATLLYGKWLAYNRHPEYAKTTGAQALASAEDLMKDILAGWQLPSGDSPAQAPSFSSDTCSTNLVASLVRPSFPNECGCG